MPIPSPTHPPHDGATTERFLVTGAMGCLGAWTIRVLVAEGEPVVGLDLSGDTRRLEQIVTREELARVTFVEGDVTSRESLDAVLDEHEITNVIHLAALQIPFCREDPSLGALVNVVGTVNVFEAVKRRRERMRTVVYASSAALYGAVDAETAASDESALARPSTHYGVYKQANEGNARIFWQDDGIPSIGLRPYNVYGPARDQGVTSAPTYAMAAASRGEPYHIPYGGRLVFNYTRDVARTFILASRASYDGAAVFNVPGSVAHMRDVVTAIEAAAPEAAGKITFEDAPLPLPEDLATGGLEVVAGPVSVTPLAEGVRETIAHFRRLGSPARA